MSPSRRPFASEVVLPAPARRWRVQTRAFAWLLAFFVAAAAPLAWVASATLQASIHRGYAERALRESQVVAAQAVVRAALTDGVHVVARVNPLANALRTQLGADYVVVTDVRGVRVAHPEADRLGERMVGGDFTSFRAGRSVTETVLGTLGMSVRAKVPVWSADGRVVGLASVGFLLPRLRDVFWDVVRAGAPWYAGIMVLALLGAHALSLGVRREMFGLEPEQIASVAVQYRTVLHALEEGVVVLRGDMVHYLNPQAAQLVGGPPGALPVPLAALLPDVDVRAWRHGAHDNVPLSVRGVPVLANVRVAPDGARVVTLRDHARVRALADELTQAQRYAELLRAQTHEFTNRLHTLAGLLHLGEVDAALSLIYERERRQSARRDAVVPLRHLHLMALLLGKFERAEELGVTLTLDPLSALPEGVDAATLDAVELAVGNLVQNAFDATLGVHGARVRLLVAADPEGVQVEVQDNGPGVPPTVQAHLGTRGVSSKGAGRGVGLALVRDRAAALGGTLAYDRRAGMTVFTLTLPFREDA
ncbi:ATP-binding protein [Deinococcus maricopensis]|uniref:histidine kinase n=1 Tax=Deinococcus maricopensis (strain DSM 21211 / LMG 22137 / NRRL B-23946 / LB-34) TaxID=709986 RepID=E8U7M9_DEIML|nr:ATP-binding protein [Deinococcus maricopensis]ADV67068.1 signal transduction histidine kinase regulating citrate/malate metabolism [Deinococcus maricopensis DSM 21211]